MKLGTIFVCCIVEIMQNMTRKSWGKKEESRKIRKESHNIDKRKEGQEKAIKNSLKRKRQHVGMWSKVGFAYVLVKNWELVERSSQKRCLWILSWVLIYKKKHLDILFPLLPLMH